MPKAALDQTAMASETALFRTAVSNWQAPRVIFLYEERGRRPRAEGAGPESGRRRRPDGGAQNMSTTAMASEIILSCIAVSNWQCKL